MTCRQIGDKPLYEPMMFPDLRCHMATLVHNEIQCSMALYFGFSLFAWWRHQMEAFSALLALCAGNSPVTGEFPTHRPVTQSFDVFFDLRLNKRLSKQSWFESLSRSLWRHCNGRIRLILQKASWKWYSRKQCLNHYFSPAQFFSQSYYLHQGMTSVNNGLAPYKQQAFLYPNIYDKVI